MKLRIVTWMILITALAFTFSRATAADGQTVVVTLKLEGALNAVMLDHISQTEQIASQRQAEVIIVELDTPGGSIDLMNGLVEEIRGSQIPIVVYVSPRGAMAASAGTIITLAGHANAMAPETTIGAASPVGSQGEDIGQTMESKVKEVLKATVRSLAANRPQKAIDLAQDMIENARAVSVDEALAAGLVDYKATDLNDLLKQMDGKTIKVQDRSIQLHTLNAQIVEVPRSFMEDLLTILENPNIVFLLLAVGLQAILIELSHPGAWIPGFIGVVSILLAAYGLGVLSVNWFGLLFMALAFVLFILDIKAPTHGALTAVGAGCFILGALVLFNMPDVPSVQRVSVPLVIGTGLFIGLVFFTLVSFALRAQHAPLRMGRPILVGQIGLVNATLNPVGTVQVGGELWSAVLADETQSPLSRGEEVEVVSMDNLQIQVKRLNHKEPS